MRKSPSRSFMWGWWWYWHDETLIDSNIRKSDGVVINWESPLCIMLSLAHCHHHHHHHHHGHHHHHHQHFHYHHHHHHHQHHRHHHQHFRLHHHHNHHQYQMRIFTLQKVICCWERVKLGPDIYKQNIAKLSHFLQSFCYRAKYAFSVKENCWWWERLRNILQNLADFWQRPCLMRSVETKREKA